MLHLLWLLSEYTTLAVSLLTCFVMNFVLTRQCKGGHLVSYRTFSQKLFCKTNRFLVLLSTWTIQNSLDNADDCMPLMQGCPPPLNNSTTGHYNSTGTHSTSLWLAFLTSIQQGRALEHAFLALNSVSMHCHAYQKYIGSLQNTDASIFRTCSSGPYAACNGGVPLYKIGKVDALK